MDTDKHVVSLDVIATIGFGHRMLSSRRTRDACQESGPGFK